MRRDLSPLAERCFDLLVIGGGIHGACIAWDAALRGLTVALVERGDFGQETSANSLKTVHGGLRYLQDLNLSLVRSMIHERKSLLRIAPHLVHQLPCLMPTYNRLMKSKPLMAVALKLNDLIGFDRNNFPDAGKHLPPSRVVSREECLRLLPGLPGEGITGGATWYDGQMYNSERLTLSFALSAEKRGACVANYVEAIGLLREGERVVGITARDRLAGEQLEIRARMVVNAAGPWVDFVLEGLGRPRKEKKFRHSLAMNLVTRKFIDEYAAGVLSRPQAIPGSQSAARKGRMLFISPWREYSLVGTFHAHYDGHPDAFRIDEAILQQFIDETNTAYPGAQLTLADVRFVHKGFLPANDGKASGDPADVSLVRQGQVYDHQKDEGISGLVTVVGVKYTSARQVAEQAVNLVFRRLGKEPPACRTDATPLHDGQIPRFSEYLSQAVQAGSAGNMAEELVRQLVYSYGSEYPRLLDLIQSGRGNGRAPLTPAEVLRAEVLYAVRAEKAQQLADVVLRRTGLGSAGRPEEAALQCCAEVMGAELGWDARRRSEEIEATRAVYSFLSSG
jgi:glycerol-3-phosphate dehydrogenase